jgi:hypothetical protein
VAIRKTEEEKQAERQAMERARLAREVDQARAKYLASPLGQAETAYQAAQAFFQLTVNISEVQGRASDWNYSQTTQTRAGSTQATCSARSRRWAGTWSTSATCLSRRARSPGPR